MSKSSGPYRSVKSTKPKPRKVGAAKRHEVNRGELDSWKARVKVLEKQSREDTKARKKADTVLGRELVRLAKRVEYLGATIIDIGALAHAHGKAE